jgi:hypothetical protein
VTDDSPSRHVRLAPIVIAAVTFLALVSVWHSARPTWDGLRTDYRVYSDYSEEGRVDAASQMAGIAGGLFRFLSAEIGRGDRVYFQVPRRSYGTLDLHDTIAALGRYYLLPAVEVTDPDDATVVVSYESDPGELHREFLRQEHYGPTVVVSWLASP